MQGDNYVRIARENIDLKSKVSSLEEQLDQLRGELQKTHIHQHFTKGGNNSINGGSTTTSPPPEVQPTTRFHDSDPSSSSKSTAKLEAEIQRLNAINAATQKKLETALGEVDQTKQMCEKRIWQLQHEFELLSAASSSKVAEEEEKAAEDGKELIYQKKWNTASTDVDTGNSSSQLQGEIDGLKAAMEVLRAELEDERAQREEGETMLEIVQNELADTQQQLADTVPPPTAGADDDGGPPPEEDYYGDEDGAPPPFSPPASPSRTGKLSPSMAREESVLFQEEHAAKIEEIVQQRLEEEKYLIEVDHEDDMNTLKIELAEKDAKIKELSLELGRSQLAQKNNAAAKKEAPVLPVVEEDMWTSPTKRTKKDGGGGDNMISAADYEAALEKIEQAESGKAQAMKKVAELADKLNQLQRKLKQHDSKTPATTSIGVALLDENRPSDRDSNWAERLLAEKDVELAEAQSHRLTAESELGVVSGQLNRINAKHQEEIGKLNNAQSILEREIQDLKRDRDQQNQRAQGAGAKNALLLSRKAPGSGSGITFGRAAGSSTGNVDSLNSSIASGGSLTPKKSAPPKAPLRERLLQKQAIKSKAAASSASGGGGGGDHVSLEERTKCVDGAADKADMIIGRLTRMMVTAEGSKAPRHWDPSKGTDPSLTAGSAGDNSSLSEETKDALSEMLAESLMDYEFALSQLRNEVLSLRTIVTMTESDVREEYQGRLSRMEAEMGDLRAAAQMHDEDRSRLHQQQQQRARQQQQQ